MFQKSWTRAACPSAPAALSSGSRCPEALPADWARAPLPAASVRFLSGRGDVAFPAPKPVLCFQAMTTTAGAREAPQQNDPWEPAAVCCWCTSERRWQSWGSQPVMIPAQPHRASCPLGPFVYLCCCSLEELLARSREWETGIKARPSEVGLRTWAVCAYYAEALGADAGIRSYLGKKPFTAQAPGNPKLPPE